LLAQTLDLVADIAGLHRAAAGTVDAQDDTLGMIGLERLAQRGHQPIGAGVRPRRDDALDLDQRRVIAGASDESVRLLA
jgi:hypothetical protein